MSARPGQRRYAITLPVEGLAGAAVRDIGEDMLAAAKRFEMPVTCDVNGTHLMALPGSTLAEIEADYTVQMERSK